MLLVHVVDVPLACYTGKPFRCGSCMSFMLRHHLGATVDAAIAGCHCFICMGLRRLILHMHVANVSCALGLVFDVGSPFVLGRFVDLAVAAYQLSINNEATFRCCNCSMPMLRHYHGVRLGVAHGVWGGGASMSHSYWEQCSMSLMRACILSYAFGSTLGLAVP